MATNFPTSLDSLTNPSGTDSMSSPSHAGQHADANDAIEALQAKVGADGSAVTTSLDYKVANLESRPVETKTASYVLVAGDVNKRIVMNNAGATTITVNDGVFAAGDSVWIHNIGAGTTTVTAGTATVDTAGSLDVGQWEGGSLYFTSASSAIFFRGGGAVTAANFTNTATGTYTDSGTNYKYITFTSSTTFTIDKAGLADILIIGGGGAGGGNRGGGGGAGGYWEQTGVYFPEGTHTVAIGGGAVGYGGQEGHNGYATICGPFVSPGGAGGGAYFRGGLNGGGSGGGAAYPGGGGIGTSGLGKNGGAHGGVDNAGGGGGGAGANGGNASGISGGVGGAGTSSSITGSAVTRAGGGGGGAQSTGSGTGGSGGAGGGGGGGGTNRTTPAAGTANTGGGGGGFAGSGQGASGGSGVVIVRVEV